MLNSLRAQLTLWYTGVLALVLVSFAGATYAYLAHQAQQRTDDSLTDTTNVKSQDAVRSQKMNFVYNLFWL